MLTLSSLKIALREIFGEYKLLYREANQDILLSLPNNEQYYLDNRHIIRDVTDLYWSRHEFKQPTLIWC